MSERKLLIAKFDVTGLSEAEVGRLEMEVAVQAEASEGDADDVGHPDVPVRTEVVSETETYYVANVIGECLIEAPRQPNDPLRRTERQGDPEDAVWSLYGDAEGVTCVVRASDEHDVERRLIRVFGDGIHIDDMGVSTSQEEPQVEETREMLVHLNVVVPSRDQRSANEVADAILGALEVGSDDDSVRELKIVSPLAEEI